ncbi:MAG: Eco29kI family restriction endonuclease [Verrucomicrobia bacterium]|jgi:hypothetical protein|nr:Eco29kI family restriction endonuclease [Verrucomicrobiota bacterium]
MNDERIYNPLDKDHLAESIVREFFKRQLHPLPPAESFAGAGIYALYYRGDVPLYREISNSLKRFLATRQTPVAEQPTPIYIGKSDPPGSRKGLFEEETSEEGEEEVLEVLTSKPKHRRLHERLRQHGVSISLTQNLKAEDFQCRYMLVDEVWVALGEARLVDWFRPAWNVLIEGFGSKVEGGGRATTARSVWDILHPGRKENLGIQVAPRVEAKLVADLRNSGTFDELRSAIKAHRDAKRQFRKDRKLF